MWLKNNLILVSKILYDNLFFIYISVWSKNIKILNWKYLKTEWWNPFFYSVHTDFKRLKLVLRFFHRLCVDLQCYNDVDITIMSILQLNICYKDLNLTVSLNVIIK